MTIALVLLIALVAFGRGGYEPWATLALEIGAALLVVAAVSRAGGTAEEISRRRARYRAWMRLPFSARHPFLARCLRVASFGAWSGGGSTAEIEILMPRSEGLESVELDPSRETFVLGYPFKRTGLGPPLVLLSLWMVLSVAPLPRGVLDVLSPTAARLRSGAASLFGLGEPGPAPWSLTPFLSARSLWLWAAVLAVFLLAVAVARREESARRLTIALLLLGVGSGIYGMVGWFEDIRAAYGVASGALRARGSFGNPNHYAAFQTMLLLVGLGWLAHFRAGGRGRRREGRESLAVIAGIGLLLAALGLVLSLSRSGLTACLGGAAVFAFLSRERPMERSSRGRSSARAYAAFALAVVGLTVWIGIEPLVGRFAELDEQWEVEGTRLELWRDSLPAVADFWLTGSGLGSFRYVGPRYRSFGGRTFFSWAHNDYLQLAIELGLPGALLVLWLGFAMLGKARRARDDLEESPPMSQLHAGYAAALAAMVLHSATDFSLHLPANLALVAIVVGVVVGMEGPEATGRLGRAATARARRGR